MHKLKLTIYNNTVDNMQDAGLEGVHKNVLFFYCAKNEQTPVWVYVPISKSKTFPKTWCKNIQPKQSYEGPK